MAGENPGEDEDRFERYDSGSPDRVESPEPETRPDAGGGGKTASPSDEEKILDLGRATGLAVGGMTVGLAVQVITFILVEFSPINLPETVSNVALISSLFVGLLLAAGFYLSFTEKEFSYIRLKFPTLKDVGFAVIGLFGMLIALVGVGFIIQTLGAEAAEHGTVETMENNPNLALYMAFLSIIAIGPAEETLFRGVIQTRLKESFSVWGAIVSTNVIFALVHIPAYGGLGAGAQELATTLVILFTISLSLGWLYERSNNLFVPMLTHGLYNSTLFTMVYLTNQYSEELNEIEAEAANLFFLLF